jgi:hypothetical protein
MADGFSYVALLDVLGYRAHVKRDRDHGTLDFKDKLAAGMGALAAINEDDIRRIAISDTIILSTSSPTGLSDLLAACVKLFLSFMRQGLLLRGGVAYSQHFHNGDVTYSHALTLAHALEHNEAIWPRILVAKDALDASVGNGKDLFGSGLIHIWNERYLLNVVPHGQWNEVFTCARKIFSDLGASCPEDVFVKFILLEKYLMNHPERPKRKAGFIQAPLPYE